MIVPLLLAALGSAGPPQGAPPVLDAYDLVWTTPSAGSAGSMPIGNGRFGANAWLEPQGDLVLLCAHTDAWSEASRLLKPGRVRVALGTGTIERCEQRLRLREGRIDVTIEGPDGRASLSILFDPDAPVARVAATLEPARDVCVALEGWRDARRVLKGQELESSWAMRGAPESVEVAESADVVLDAGPAAVATCHRNATSIVAFTLRHQGLGELAGRVEDPLAGRAFGLRVEGAGLARTGPRTLSGRVAALDLRISGPCGPFADAAAWLKAAEQLAAAAPDLESARGAASRTWREAWDRAWILVDGDPDHAVDCDGPSRVTQAWLLQRWVTLAGGRGAFPIKFNGSIFTVEPAATGGPPLDADWRRWGGDYWWQNTRLPYFAALARGDFAILPSLYGFYERALPLARERARRWYGAGGAWFPETMTVFGSYSNGDYGWERAGLEPGNVQCPWWQWSWQQGLELLQLQLEHHAHVPDRELAVRRIVPLARDVLAWFDTRFRRDEHGKLVLTPTQALETYWTGVVDDLPTVAGLRSVLDGLLALPGDVGEESDRALWSRLRAACPEIPTREDGDAELLAPAARHDAQRRNCETPELYAVFPFPLYGVGRERIELARAAYERRADRSHAGWTQDGIFAARLGLTEAAREDLVARARNHHAAHRFPAMWGPNFDWLPDQCHGANLQNVLQSMLLQAVGDEIHLMPAWPPEWDVEFRLVAPQRTTVTGTWRERRWQRLEVDPPSRRDDVRLHLGT